MTSPLRHVFQPGRIGSLTLPHRVVMGPMHLGLESRDDRGEALGEFYAERARGGAGLIVTGGAAVSEAGAGGPGYGVLTDPAFAGRLRHVVARVHAEGALIALQLFHAGRYAPPRAGSGGPVAPSPVHSRISGATPRELPAAEVHDVVAEFGAGARLAVELGFDAVHVMGSEGYLVDQFLSPLTNLRDDEWGGDAARRARFGVEVVRRVRAEAGRDFPVIARLTGDDLMPGGVAADDVLDFARALSGAGVDAIDVGIGWHESPVPTVQAAVPAGTWAPVADRIAGAVDVPVVCGNRITRLDQADDLLARGRSAFVSMARPFLADAELVNRERSGHSVMRCVGCNQACIDRSLSHQEVSCLVNPRAGRELGFPRVRVTRRRRAVVVGGGPAGMQAAITLAGSGCEVELLERGDSLGGQFRLASKVPGKQDYERVIDHLTGELHRSGVVVRLCHPVTDADVPALLDYDAVVLATGVTPRSLDVPGACLPHVLSYPRAFEPGALRGSVVVIGGGGVAVDVAHFAAHGDGDGDPVRRFLADHDLGAESGHVPPRRAVTVVHRGPRLGPRLGRSTRWVALKSLRRNGVRTESVARIDHVDRFGVTCTDQAGRQRFVPADTVVVAVGQTTEPAPARAVRAAGVPHHVVGGARTTDGLDAVLAFSDGLTIGTALAAELGALRLSPLHTVRGAT